MQFQYTGLGFAFVLLGFFLFVGLFGVSYFHFNIVNCLQVKKKIQSSARNQG